MTASPKSAESQFQSGLIYGLIAYTVWGAVPLYFSQVFSEFAAVGKPDHDLLEILAHRIGWSMPLMVIVTLLTPGGARNLWGVLRSPKLVGVLLLSSAFLSGNWLLYIYATETKRIAEAALGYFMLPLVNALLATVFLREKLRPLHYPALAIIAGGVLVLPMVVYGEFLWISVALPLSFGVYGLIRKMIPVDGGTGLTVETLLLVFPCLGYIAYRGWIGAGAFGLSWSLSAWLVLGGFMTVVPLLTYTLSIRRLPLLTQSFIQFISPLVQLLIAVFAFHQGVDWVRWVALSCVLVAVGIFVTDAALMARKRRRAANAMPEPVGAR